MSLPAFRELSAPADCDCSGCTAAARRQPLPRPTGRRSARSRTTRLATVTVLAGVAFAGAGAAHAQAAEARPVAADARGGAAGSEESWAPARAQQDVTRAQILARAQAWVDAGIPYSMNAFHQGYRTDCSGFVSMAWALGDSHWTGDLHEYGVRITKEELQPGDMLLRHNDDNPERGSHVVLFAGWANAEHTRYEVMEETPSYGAVKRTIPYAYSSNGSSYVPYRYKGLQSGGGSQDETGGGSQDQTGDAFPGAGRFGPGADNAHVTRLGTMLVGRGAGRFYTQGPDSRWGAADAAATRAFQQAQGWSGADADGIPGSGTWRLLVEGGGQDVGTGGAAAADFPGARYFAPGASNRHVTLLGERLVKKGFGQSYTEGPGPTWSEADRSAVEAFQRAQGWSGSEADGYPGAHTWRLLFS
ncbi:peptidoglycan-binding protein [Streptomyces sp. NPDC050485]|uniref:peptidoglycan-binding protein n=1 Tax=Streptomyces sp. NPDC050485 TaxID=3365617 RepID=UPI0037946C6C